MSDHVSLDEHTDTRLVVGGFPTQQENLARHHDTLDALADRLLGIGGESVVVPHFQPDVANFVLTLCLRKGEPFDPENAAVEEGEPSECHANVVSLWREGRGAICTGYALSPDGLWRPHSWLREPSGRIVETTERRDAYYGHEFDEEGAAIFADLA